MDGECAAIEAAGKRKAHRDRPRHRAPDQSSERAHRAQKDRYRLILSRLQRGPTRKLPLRPLTWLPLSRRISPPRGTTSATQVRNWYTAPRRSLELPAAVVAIHALCCGRRPAQSIVTPYAAREGARRRRRAGSRLRCGSRAASAPAAVPATPPTRRPPPPSLRRRWRRTL